MKACSFLPGVTNIIYELGLEEYLFGVTFECHSEKPKVVRSYLEGNTYSSEEIDKIVSQHKAEGKDLYYLDIPLLQEIAPDIIFTQDVCDVCQIDTAHVQRAIAKLPKTPEVIPLIPRNLDDVYSNILTIAKALGKEQAGINLMNSISGRSGYILDVLRQNKAPLRKVMLLEWLNPIYNCGHWIPFQIAQAGGIDMLSNPGGYSIVTDWKKILQYDPEVLVVAPCGFTTTRALEEMTFLTKLEGWKNLKAVKNNAVYVADADLFTQPGAGLINGVELLAAIFHPDLFSVPDAVKNKYLNLQL